MAFCCGLLNLLNLSNFNVWSLDTLIFLEDNSGINDSTNLLVSAVCHPALIASYSFHNDFLSVCISSIFCAICCATSSTDLVQFTYPLTKSGFFLAKILSSLSIAVILLSAASVILLNPFVVHFTILLTHLTVYSGIFT